MSDIQQDLAYALEPITRDIQDLATQLAALENSFYLLNRRLERLEADRPDPTDGERRKPEPLDERQLNPLRQVIQSIDDRLKLVENNWS